MKIDLFDLPDLIAFISQGTTLTPGDLIFTGTPPGVGAFRKPPAFLQVGDEVTVEDLYGSAWQPVAVSSSSGPCPGSRTSLIVVSSADMVRLRATPLAMIENRNLVDVRPLIGA